MRLPVKPRYCFAMLSGKAFAFILSDFGKAKAHALHECPKPQVTRARQEWSGVWKPMRKIEGIGTCSLKKRRLKKWHSSKLARYKDIPGESYLSMSTVARQEIIGSCYIKQSSAKK